MKVLLIDNYDSFTYNLYHVIAAIDGSSVTVLRNDDRALLSRIATEEFDAVVIGPGPGSPDDRKYFGQCLEIIQEYGGKGLPILGVCLGFQGIAHAFGAKLKRARQPMHGKTSPLNIHDESAILNGIHTDSEVMRYHSIMIDTDYPMPREIRVTAEVVSKEETVRVNGREVMAIAHHKLPIYGVQFHPESYYTPSGKTVIGNFISIARATNYTGRRRQDID